MRNGYSKVLKYNKQALIETMTDNREEHLKDYELAVQEYHVQLVARLESMLEEARLNQLRDTDVGLVEPVSYVEVYDDAIMMFDMCQEGEIELSQEEFRQLVQDKWDWKSHFNTNTAVYASAAKMKML